MRATIVIGVAVAALGLSAPGALAAGTAAQPTGPSVANTTQTETVGMGTTDDPYYSYEIDFATTTFTIPQLGDAGTFKLKGMTLTLSVHSSAGHDKGCTFPGKYNPMTQRYEGTYTCRQNDRDSFVITTTGAS